MMSLSFLITLGLAVVILAVAAGMTARTRAARPAVIGAGLAALVVGYWLTGWTQLTINGIASLVDWFQRTALTTPVAWGTGLLVGGLIVAVVGTLLPKGSGQPPKTPSATAGSGPRAATGGPGAATKAAPGAGAVPVPTRQKSTPQVQKGAQPTGLDPEDAEIEELLRKRGIM
ncbi:hypothetical protein [Tessaracoccus palaemonis]|uniref:Cellulose synthase n=1 Tax=Tessaracoccus palaemonis TaxID=2829499 RepID=A0ABX8SKG2_9ACTN|nr:hypothetical protein [Tessaracoccus palaemonis]QXT63871.1 hypothetical protein KDB89_05240 [Tessaracoccus palaemonis]